MGALNLTDGMGGRTKGQNELSHDLPSYIKALRYKVRVHYEVWDETISPSG